jgi:hypothetical protein
MPPELRKAHQLNDKAVMQAYGFWGRLNSEPECVAELMQRNKKTAAPKGTTVFFGAATQIRTGDLILTNRLETLTGSICSSQLILKNQVIPTICGFLITDLH